VPQLWVSIANTAAELHQKKKENRVKIKVGLHNHSQMSDGTLTVSELLKHLKASGYDAVAITDHNVVTVPHPLQLQDVEDLLLIRGVELTFPSIHIMALEPQVLNMGTVGILKSSEVTWICHPKLTKLTPQDCVDICSREGLDGVEQYNSGFVQCYEGDHDLNLYAGDDLHIPEQVMSSWIEMEVDDLDKDQILAKLKAGDFETFNRPLPGSLQRWWEKMDEQERE
jgi:hypothetical protein